MQRQKIAIVLYMSMKSLAIIDSCDVDNGGCDKNADCSHQKKTFAVVCTCKMGYTNIGKDGKVECKGMEIEII